MVGGVGDLSMSVACYTDQMTKIINTIFGKHMFYASQIEV